MRVHQWTGDLLSILLFSGLAAGGILTGVSVTPIRLAFALPLVLLVPGYAFISALFPEAPDEDGFGTVERVVLSIAVSLAVVGIVAYAANFTPYGITVLPITVAVVAWTVAFSLLGLARRARLAPEDRYGLRSGIDPAVVSGLFTVQQRRAGDTRGRGPFEAENGRHVLLNVVLVFSLLALVAGGGYMALAAPSLPDEEPYTELYLLSENDEGELTTEPLPTDLSAGETEPITVAIENHEGETQTYTTVVYQQEVTLSDDGQTVESVDGEEELDRFETTVENGETERVGYEVGPTADGDVHVWFLLYEGDAPENPSPENADQSTRLAFTG